MKILTRTVLAWLLMLAIPVQGFAATAMLFCAPGHHGVVTITVDQPSTHARHASPELAAHRHGEMQQTSHHGHDTASSASSSYADDSTSSHTTPIKVGKPGDGKCSACAACCTGSALVSTQSMNHAAMTGSALIPFTLASFVSHIPQGFDPPPRFILA